MPDIESISPTLSGSVAQGGVADQAGGIAYSGVSDAEAAGEVAFGGPTADFILWGVVNGAFAQGPPDPNSNIEPVNNPLPYWSGPTQVSGGAITCQWVVDAASPSGYNLRFTMGPGVAGDEAYVEQIIPIGGDRRQLVAVPTRMVFTVVSISSGNVRTVIGVRYLDINGAAIGNDVEEFFGMAAPDTNVQYAIPHSSTVMPPAEATYLRIRVGVRRHTVPAAGSAVVDMNNVRSERGFGTLAIAETSSIAAYGPAQLFQEDGVLWLYPAGGLGQVLLGNSVLMPEVTAPATPPSGYGVLYVSTTGRLRFINDAGTDTAITP